MNKLAITFVAVLSLVPNLNYQTPTLDTPQSDSVVVSFFDKPVDKFPDRSVQAKSAIEADKARLAEIERIRALEAQKQTEAQAQTQKPVEVAQNTPVDSNSAKMFIYMKESGNNPLARNSAGCLGLGQACPGSKLLAVCPNLDYACQDAFFTNYALSRYGSWEGALAFWQSHNWW